MTAAPRPITVLHGFATAAADRRDRSDRLWATQNGRDGCDTRRFERGFARVMRRSSPQAIASDLSKRRGARARVGRHDLQAARRPPPTVVLAPRTAAPSLFASKSPIVVE